MDSPSSTAAAPIRNQVIHANETCNHALFTTSNHCLASY
ncbi:hypothetical protein LINPERHAP1_LOCUS26515, partial [Linum perenne]